MLCVRHKHSTNSNHQNTSRICILYIKSSRKYDWFTVQRKKRFRNFDSVSSSLFFLIETSKTKNGSETRGKQHIDVIKIWLMRIILKPTTLNNICNENCEEKNWKWIAWQVCFWCGRFVLVFIVFVSTF